MCDVYDVQQQGSPRSLWGTSGEGRRKSQRNVSEASHLYPVYEEVSIRGSHRQHYGWPRSGVRRGDLVAIPRIRVYEAVKVAAAPQHDK